MDRVSAECKVNFFKKISKTFFNFNYIILLFSLSPSDHLIDSRGLFQAVRSYLHFSQLSAWLKSSRGENPNNLLFRVTIPGEAFATKFSLPPEQHFFPRAGERESYEI